MVSNIITLRYCHKSSLYGSLRAPPEGSLTRVLTRSSGLQFPQNPVPGTDHPYRCQSLAGLLKLSLLTHQCEVLFCPADNSKLYPVSITCCLPDLFTHSDCLPPALDPACLAFILSPVCCLPRSLPSLRLRFSHSTIFLTLLPDLCLSDLLYL